jgi:hypothetical protein
MQRFPILDISPGDRVFLGELPSLLDVRTLEGVRREGQGFESPQLHRNTRPEAMSGILYQEDDLDPHETRDTWITSMPSLGLQWHADFEVHDLIHRRPRPKSCAYTFTRSAGL